MVDAAGTPDTTQVKLQAFGFVKEKWRKVQLRTRWTTSHVRAPSLFFDQTCYRGLFRSRKLDQPRRDRWCDRDASVQSEPALLLERAEELQTHCAEHGFPYFAAVASVYRGSALSALGSADEGLALLTEGLAAYRATGALVLVPNFLRLLADCYRRAGQPKEGLKYLDEAAALIEATQGGIFPQRRRHLPQGNVDKTETMPHGYPDWGQHTGNG
jgi:tetratricopeptide (TPR) repeat protein